MTASPPDEEQARLLARLEHALHDTTAGLARGGVLSFGFFLVLSITLAAMDAWAFAGLMTLVGVGVLWATHATARNNAPEKMRPVLEAVRDAPERVTLLHHSESSDSNYMSSTHWVLIRTTEGHLLVRATHDWQELLAMLQRRCSNAKVTHA